MKKVFMSILMLACLALTGLLVVSMGMGLPMPYGLSGVVCAILAGYWAACHVDQD